MKKNLLNIYNVIIYLLGLLVILQIDFHSFTDLGNIIILVILNIIFNLFAVRTSTGIHLSLSMPILFATQLIHGMGPALFVNFWGILAHSIRFKRPLNTFFFNLGQLSIAIFLVEKILQLVPYSTKSLVLYTENLPVIFLALITLDFLNHLLVILYISLKEGGNFIRLFFNSWFQDVKRVIPLYYTVGIALATLYHVHGVVGEFFVALPLIVAYFVLIDQQLIQTHKQQAERDPLTNCLNRRCLDEWLERQLPRVINNNAQVSAIMIDIDNFKNVNDSYGHLIGDEFLKKIARALKDNLRKSDRLFRYGGEEFLIILPETDQKQALKIAERLRQTVSEISIRVDEGEEIRITVSLGVSSLKFSNDQEETLQECGGHYELVRQADNALYLAKQRGKNRVEIYSS